MEEEESQPNIEANDENVPHFDEAKITQWIQSKELDRSNDECSIPIQKLDGEKPQVTAASVIVDGDESKEDKAAVLEEGLFESRGKGGEHVVNEIRGDNVKEKRSDYDGSLVNEQLNEELKQSAGKDGNFSSFEEALVEKGEKVFPLVEELSERGGEAKAHVFDELKKESIEEKLLDFDGAHRNEHLKEELLLLGVKEGKISSLEGGLGDNGEEGRAHAMDEVMEESVREKLLYFDGACQNEHLKEEMSLSDEKEETVPSFEEAVVEKDKSASLLDEGIGEKGEDNRVFDDMNDEEGTFVGKEEKASSLKQEKDEHSTSIVNEQTVGEEKLNEEGPRSVEGVVKVHPLQETLIETDEKVSQWEEELVERGGEAKHHVDETMQENVEKKLDFIEKSAEKDDNFSQLRGVSVKKEKEGSYEKEDDKEMDIDEGGPAMAAGRRTSMKRKSCRHQVSQRRRMKARSKPKEDESLCFICFDGGDLVVCDHRSCPKVYHPSCVNRDEEYFKAKGMWICGWHICSNCQKSARYMCFTCTYSLCKDCIKEADFACVRENKGFCPECMKTVMLIEANMHADKTTDVVDFDDKTSWMSLFKDYWLDLNATLSLTMDELTRARNPLKEANVASSNEEPLNKTRELQCKEEPLENSGSAHDNHGESSSSRPRRHKESTFARKNLKKWSRITGNTELQEAQVERTAIPGDIEWASKELLKFVAHMRDGDESVLSHFDVQSLLLKYIKQNNLRDPHRKSQINCDSKLLALFGKSRVGHIEMLKLLEPHFLIKEASPLATDDNQGGVVDPDPSQMDVDRNSDASTKKTFDKRRKSRRRVEGGVTSLDEYAAIDVHNVSLLYLRRNLMENLLEIDMFNETVVGAFVRIRISGSASNKDMYRLVQVVGTGKAAGKYKTDKKTTDVTLEILNLNKREIITIDLISNQEFTEEECKRLRQSVECGFIDRLTVAQVQEKARCLHAMRVNDWLENEKLRLGHLRDRASEKGRIKEHRDCVEKLQLLSTPEEHIRRLNEVPDVHADPKMDPDYEFTEDDEDLNSERQEKNKTLKYSFKDEDEFPIRRVGSASRKNSDVAGDSNRSALKAGVQGVVSPTVPPVRTDGPSRTQGHACEVSSPKSPKANVNVNGSNSCILKNSQPVIEPAQISVTQPQTAPQPPSTNAVSLNNLSETDKFWHYQDPAGKVQGPFSMAQLRKWSSNGFFPTNLRIWRTSEKQQESILLTDAISGKFHNDVQKQEPQHRNADQPTSIAAAVMESKADNLGGDMGGNNISQPSQPSSSSKTIVGIVSDTDGRRTTSSTGYESSNNLNARSGQSQVRNCPRPLTPFSRNLPQQPSSERRDGRGENSGRWNGGQGHQHNWNPNRPRSFPPNGRGYERQHPYRSSSGQRFSGEQLKVQQPVNRPAHSLQSGSIDWASLQGAINRIIPSPSPCNLTSTMNSAGGCGSIAPSNVNPAMTRENTGALNNLQQQNKPSESTAVVTTQTVDGSNTKQCLESNSSSITPNSDQASAGVLNNPDMNMAGAHTVPSNNDATKTPTEAQETQLGSAAASNPVGCSNLSDASASTSMAPTESQCFAPVSAQEQGANGLNVNPAQPLSMVYPTMPGATNMGWGMVAHGPMNMNWGAPANMNMGWAQPAQATMNANLGWAIPAQGMAMQVSPAARPGWVAPVIGNANPNPCWVAPPTIGNASQSAAWGAMMPGTGHPGMNIASNQNAGDGGSSHPHPGEQRVGVCQFYMNGYCKKGASCNFIHRDQTRR